MYVICMVYLVGLKVYELLMSFLIIFSNFLFIEMVF